MTHAQLVMAATVILFVAAMAFSIIGPEAVARYRLRGKRGEEAHREPLGPLRSPRVSRLRKRDLHPSEEAAIQRAQARLGNDL